MLKYILVLVLCASVSHVFGQTTVNEFEENIIFNFFLNNTLVHQSTSFDENLGTVCDSNQPWALIAPGWTEDCSAPWALQLIPKLTQYRGGCIVCMDYYKYSSDSSLLGYFHLVDDFDSISAVLLKKLRQFERDGFDPLNGFAFGFSFGAQLVINAGRDFGGKLWAIDACEPAGPGFYPNAIYQARGSPKKAAKNVQTIHTSTDLGTIERDSHQDWLMGKCGIDQPGAPYYITVPLLILKLGLVHNNHIMCPTFYVNAFENNFPAKRRSLCINGGRDVSPVPLNFSMGYRQENKQSVQGTLYAYTYNNPPYNTRSPGELTFYP